MREETDFVKMEVRDDGAWWAPARLGRKATLRGNDRLRAEI